VLPAALVLAALLPTAPPAAAPELPRGQVIERVVAKAAPAQSYALYLPSAYTPEKLWPVLYVLDARGRALFPLELFRPAAEEFGWILVSSYNSASDTKDDLNAPAMTAIWNDAVGRFAIDGRRVYAAGFSGTGRAAVGMGYALPGRIAGVISAGAGFEDSRASIKSVPFAYFGTVGDRDMNYYEMRSLEEKLENARALHRIAYFEGPHAWMPPELARASVAWMELQAMKAATRPRDPGRIAALQSEARRRAASLEAAGRRVEAQAAWAQTAEDFRGLADAAGVAEDEKRSEALARLPEVRTALKDARRRDARDEATLRTINTKLRNALAQSDPPPPSLLAAELGIPALRRQAASDTPEERLSAERILANLRAATAFYLPQEMLDRRDPTRARALLGVAAEIDPDNPLVYYNLACDAARSGNASRAIADLDRAVARGFRRFELIDEDADFAPIRNDAAFQKWLADARAAAPAPGS